ncbi:P-loop containing nucleoside triphosphate hydrolase protein [Blastocladiella britannica]|nr:P-loop containing nucleoside triphosphate hydrolase protein [Blastocladiella britannica]
MPAASTVLSVTFFFRVLAMLLTLHTYLRVNLNADQPLYFALFVSGLVLSVLALVLSSLDQGRGLPKDVAENSASPFSKFTFSWLLPMLFLARKQTLTMDNISDTNKLFCVERLEMLRREVVDACALTRDLAFLPNGDLTLVGDKGVNLSGGQKARIGLARAVYADRDIVLLDDCLSAVDAHVDRSIFNKVLGPNGLLHGKTVVLVTHGTHHMVQCEYVVLLKDGTIAEQGPLEQVVEQQGGMYRLLAEFSNTTILSSTSSAAAAAAAASVAATQAAMAKDPRNLLATARLLSQATFNDEDDTETSSSSATTDPVRQGTGLDSLGASQIGCHDDDDKSAAGVVTWDVYWSYLEACGKRYFAYIAPVFCLTIAVTSFQSDWLENMSTSVAVANSQGTTVDLAYYIGVYAVFTVCNGVGIFAVAQITLRVMSIHASSTLHSGLLDGILRAPMSWYDVVPAGRILTRFSTDIDTLDLEIPLSLVNFVFSAGMIASAMIILGISSPWMLMLFPIGGVYLYQATRLYLSASRELGRLQLATQAPIYQKVEESLHGLVSVRAFQLQRQIKDDIAVAMDQHMRPTYLIPSLGLWLEVTSSVLASCFILCLGLVAVLMRGTALSGYIGLGMNQALQLTWKFNTLITSFCELETKMVSVERVRQYSQVPPEAPAESDFVTDADWPAHGKIEFKEYSTTYRPDLEPALTDLSISIPAGCKVGVVGRTGAGKSSLALALFRIVEAVGGRITLDGVDIAKLGTCQLRSQLCIIPQDPMLFEGTIRDNLDPLNHHDDAALWRALELANMSGYVSGLEGKLLGEVAHAGSNFSAGQKQLITLASAILRKRKVVIFDEATSSTDAETDAVVQRTIRQEFKDCTILTIAHRVNTIRDSDRILVLDNGQVADLGHVWDVGAQHDAGILGQSASMCLGSCQRFVGQSHVLGLWTVLIRGVLEHSKHEDAVDDVDVEVGVRRGACHVKCLMFDV